MLEIKGTVDKKLIAYVERVYNHLNLDAIVDVIIQKTCENGAGGYANGDDEDVQIEIARYDSEGKLPRKQLMTNIAHELIHAQQMNYKQMVNVGLQIRKNAIVNVVEWNGKEYVNEPYATQPWELDAYSRELEVYEACK